MKNKGFTLIELVVSMAIFLLLITVGIVIFLSIVQNQKSVLYQQKVLNQVSYVLERMSKALRMAKLDTSGCLVGSEGTGYIYLLTRYNLTTGLHGGVRFINESDNSTCTEFFLDDSDPDHLILKELKIYPPSYTVDYSMAVPITSEDIDINYMKFAVNGVIGSTGGSHGVRGATSSGAVQPKLTILMNIQMKGLGITEGGVLKEPELVIQTTVSQRNLNYPR